MGFCGYKFMARDGDFSGSAARFLDGAPWRVFSSSGIEAWNHIFSATPASIETRRRFLFNYTMHFLFNVLHSIVLAFRTEFCTFRFVQFPVTNASLRLKKRKKKKKKKKKKKGKKKKKKKKKKS